MRDPESSVPSWRQWALTSLSLLLSACALGPRTPAPRPEVVEVPVSPEPVRTSPAPLPTPAPVPKAEAPPRLAPAMPSAPVPADPMATSLARDPKAYRRDAASHIYRRYPQRIYSGMLPPMLQAVGVLDVHLDRHGRVERLQWLRAPQHVPQVMREIETLVRQAAPYPVARHLGPVVWTDVWLWDQSGRFQLDTLTEGQR
ncbi:MAG: hypothetical protein RIQ38_211 [Pseudomonadota bacterium]